MELIQIRHFEVGDRALLEAVHMAMAESVRRGGDWIACRPGCTHCCLGPFAITQLDALRLRRGLEQAAPEVAARVRDRARLSAARIIPSYPGDPVTGELFEEDALPDSLDEEPCPALDPDSGLCDLYESRPMTCRLFGAPMEQGPNAYGHCELCFEGATPEEVAACAVDPDPDGLENKLVAELEDRGLSGLTIVAFALIKESVETRNNTV